MIFAASRSCSELCAAPKSGKFKAVLDHAGRRAMNVLCALPKMFDDTIDISVINQNPLVGQVKEAARH
jgi:hypothetical protein